MEEQAIALSKELAYQFPQLAIFASILGLVVKAFLAHLKTTSQAHTEAMVKVVDLTSTALAKNTEAIFEHSRMVGATLSTLKTHL